MSHDLILNSLHTPTFEEIKVYMNTEGYALWDGIHRFIQETYGSKPKTAYSKCSGKPGWNIKYQKSGKSICTLYPEKNGFVVLVVITLELASIVQNMKSEIGAEILNMINTAKPFNGTVWLMIPVYNENVLEDLKKILSLKLEFKK